MGSAVTDQGTISSDGPSENIGAPGNRSPQVFVSYTHDSKHHKDQVLRFSTFLLNQGIDAHLDQWSTDRRRDWYAWAIKHMTEADFVIVVASSGYRRAGDGNIPSHQNRGIQSEASLLRDLLHNDRETWLPKLLPVILPGHTPDDIPLFLQPYTADHYWITEFTTEGAEDLLRVITAQPGYPRPPLGPTPVLPPHPPPSATPPPEETEKTENRSAASGTPVAMIATGTGSVRQSGGGQNSANTDVVSYSKHLSDVDDLQPMAASHAAALIRNLPPNSAEPGRIGEKVLEAKLKGPVTSLCFGPDDSVLAAADTGPVRRWRLGENAELPELAARSWYGPRYGVRMAASQNGGSIVLRDRFSLHAVDADAPERGGTSMGIVAFPGYLDAASSGRYAITSWGTRFTLRSAATGQTVRTFSAVTTTMSADSRILAVAHGLAGGGKTIRVYRLVPGQEADEREYRTIELHQAAGRALQISLSPDGSLLACVTARWAGIYDVDTGEPAKSRSGDSNLLTQTFPEAMGLICTPAAHLLWMNRGKVLQMRGNRRDDIPVLPERSGYRRIAVSADGAFLAAGDAAGWMRVWRWQE